MNGHKTVVGKNLIEILMFSMYPDAKIIYREYIQNARDAINAAVKAGVLEQFKDGHICVEIGDHRKIIQISDNGIGISLVEVEPVLLNIANSTKDGDSSAGQFGIGRLVGAGYCKRLSFKTSYKGENKSTEIIFDVEKVRAILDDKGDHRSASEVIDVVTEKIIEEEDADKHYFIVTLYDVRPEYDELLDEDIIIDYLKEVAPIDYKLPFKTNLLQKIQLPYDNYQNHVKHFKISVNDEADIRKQYGLNIDGTGDSIHSLQCFKIEDDKFGLLAWGWYALTAFSKAIPTSDKNRGIRLRKHNIQIGNSDLLNQYFKEARGNNYFYGEIHAIHPKLKPESSRSGLAPTPEALCLHKHLRNYFETLVQLYHLANDVKNAIKERNEVFTQIEKTQQPLEAVPEVKEKWEAAQKKLESVERSKNAQTEAAKKIMELFYKDIQKTIDIPPPINIVSDIVSTPPIVLQDKPADILEPLKEKFVGSDIELIRRIFSIMTDKCPQKGKYLLEELKKAVVKDLGK
ncbi:hypothetical protein AGMMS4957_04740 [Bacteroidia bacterium]|nr:hypothetical protein AGMMS4957_04740 [Bacteroidia bacterium]